MEHKVTGCDKCPYNYDYQGCFHPVNYELKDDDKDVIDFTDGGAPDWCPLKKEPTIISFLKTNKKY